MISTDVRMRVANSWDPCGSGDEIEYIFYDFECSQDTGTHGVNSAIAQDYNGIEFIHKKTLKSSVKT